MPHITIEELLTDPEEVRELARHLDRCMVYTVLYLKYEPEQLEKVIESYDSLSLLREALQNELFTKTKIQWRYKKSKPN